MPATTKPSGIEATVLFARFCNAAKAFYEEPENKRRFNEWQQKRREANAVTTKRPCSPARA